MSRLHTVFTLATSVVLTGAVLWLARGMQTLQGPAEVLALFSSPLLLPVWGLWLLCLPASVLPGLLWRMRRNARRGFPVAPLAPALHADESAATEVASEAAPLRQDPLTAAAPQAADYYQEDAVFGVVWRWYGDLGASELLSFCPACDRVLVPLANGGSLSVGLHCERCNKLRAAGEHPSDIEPKVLETLRRRRRSGEWRAAPRRIERARNSATRPLAVPPAA